MGDRAVGYKAAMRSSRNRPILCSRMLLFGMAAGRRQRSFATRRRNDSKVPNPDFSYTAAHYKCMAGFDELIRTLERQECRRLPPAQWGRECRSAFQHFNPQGAIPEPPTLRTSVVRGIITRMTCSNRIGALDIVGALSERIGSYVDLYSIEFIAVEGSRIHCWYQSPQPDGPVFHVEITQAGQGWTLKLNEQAPGTDQQIEVP